MTPIEMLARKSANGTPLTPAELQLAVRALLQEWLERKTKDDGIPCPLPSSSSEVTAVTKVPKAPEKPESSAEYEAIEVMEVEGEENG